MQRDEAVYQRQGFGAQLGIQGQIGLLIIDFVNGFADPKVFGGGNIPEAIQATVPVLAEARRRGWPVAHSRIVFADDGSDHNIFTLKIPSMLSLKEHEHNSAIVPELEPAEGELVVRKTVPSAFFGTGLSAWLTQRSVQTLLVAGAVTSGCVRASVVDAMSYGFRPVVLADCVGDRALAPHEANLFDMGQKNADVRTFADLLSQLSS
ncbi:maleamate amidohydrolase [Pseudomonas duriflava]|uniref:Maleamate amidohydrolase n=1 Tax=Pseudomonas duriflava TaxID=459528 RepID=A0A562QJ27_9PSED|nr:N-carbamoylsarcosine amidohydrolase [Pseudomonas duriflava]TWI56762.1 maleamate amidohydrolase [Pseudomonas duriflava]